MSVQSKHHRPDKATAMVSQASRRDAQPANGMRFETYAEERDYWIGRLRDIEAQLSAYSKASFTKEQARIRHAYSHNERESIRMWNVKKSSMEHDRLALIEQKRKCDAEILRVNPLFKAEKLRYFSENQGSESKKKTPLYMVACEILEELRTIRSHLESTSTHTEGTE